MRMARRSSAFAGSGGTSVLKVIKRFESDFFNKLGVRNGDGGWPTASQDVWCVGTSLLRDGVP